MMNKMAESHFNALRAALDNTVKTDVPPTETTSPAAHDALDNFLSTPSFTGKQIAIESLLRQITQGTPPNKTGTVT